MGENLQSADRFISKSSFNTSILPLNQWYLFDIDLVVIVIEEQNKRYFDPMWKKWLLSQDKTP